MRTAKVYMRKRFESIYVVNISVFFEFIDTGGIGKDRKMEIHLCKT